ncbi:hypothetical protein DFJ63DRAFT_169379 [Scheffersomyces coipomensis]|uniref:uncharacterized protein n=1 Tax=Scheffersomyces coipomensis TaxID=1788519 RepID=UPI00315CAA10
MATSNFFFFFLLLLHFVKIVNCYIVHSFSSTGIPHSTVLNRFSCQLPLEKHFSKVFLSKIENTEVVLKVYDPIIGAPILNNDSGLSDKLFFEFGYFVGEKFGESCSGYYLMEEYLQDDKLDCDFDYFSMLAKESLAQIHSTGLIHGDIHQYNILYNKDRDRVYYIDFGKSTFTDIQEGERSKDIDWWRLDRALAEIGNLIN